MTAMTDLSTSIVPEPPFEIQVPESLKSASQMVFHSVDMKLCLCHFQRSPASDSVFVKSRVWCSYSLPRARLRLGS